MGGTLEVTSKEGEGSEFFFSIPLKEVQTAAKPDEEKAVSRENQYAVNFLEGKRVLLGEDYPVSRELISYYLNDSGCALDSLSSGSEILTTAANTPYDIILLDLHLPEVDGLELAERLGQRQSLKQSCFIAISADVELVEHLNEGNGPFHAALLKPFTREELISIIKQSCLETGRTSTPPTTSNGNRQSSPLEMRKVVDTLDGDSHQAFVLLEGFLAESEQSLQKLQDLLEEKNWKESHRLIHSLRSGAQLLFAGSLAQQAGELEDVLKTRMNLPENGSADSSDGYELISMLHTLFQSFEEVQTYCEQHILHEDL